MAIQELEVKDIEGIYAGETFSRKVELSIDGVVQSPDTYTLSVQLFSLTNSATPVQDSTVDTGGDNISANSSTVVIPATITENMLGYYIIKVRFDIGGYITIRKAKFKVER
jgi:hypothetical protein